MQTDSLFERQIAQRDKQNAATAAYNDFAGELKKAPVVPMPTEYLGVLSLSANTVAAGAAPGTVVGTIQGETDGSVLTLRTSDPRFALQGDDLVVGNGTLTEGPVEVRIRETLESSLNSPRDTVVMVIVTAAETGGGEDGTGDE